MPNILFIISDDLRIDNSLYTPNRLPYPTPNIERISKNAFVFDRAYVAQALCSPSRSSFLTGRRPDNIRVWNFLDSFRSFSKRMATLPELLKRAGYQTVSIGKVVHRLDSIGGDEVKSWSRYLDETGFADKDFKCLNKKLFCYCKDQFCVDKFVTDEAVKQIKEYDTPKRRGIPWFIGVGLRRPHTDYVFPQRLMTQFGNDNIPMPNLTLPYAFNTPHGMPSVAYYACAYTPRAPKWNNGKASSPYQSVSKDDIQTLRNSYFLAVKYLDERVGQVLDALDASSFKDNTIVIFTSDHGFSLGEHGMYCKQSVFEVATRVPLVIKVPWLTPIGTGAMNAKHIEPVVELLDLYPTIVDMVKPAFPQKSSVKSQQVVACLQGQSLYPLMQQYSTSASGSNQTEIKDWALSQFPRCRLNVKDKSGNYWTDSCSFVAAKNFQYMGYSIRVRNYRYTEWRVWDKGQADWSRNGLNATELYDHSGNADGMSDDVAERINYASDPKFRSLVQELSAKLKGIVTGKEHPQYPGECYARKYVPIESEAPTMTPTFSPSAGDAGLNGTFPGHEDHPSNHSALI